MDWNVHKCKSTNFIHQLGHVVQKLNLYLPHTADGRNAAPVEVGSLSHYLQSFLHPRWCRISAINSMKHIIFAHSAILDHAVLMVPQFLAADLLTTTFAEHNFDGRNPAPPGMYKTHT